MNNKLILAGLIVVFVIGAVFFIRMNQSGFDSTNQNAENVGGTSADSTIPNPDDDDREDDDSDDDDSNEGEDDEDDSGTLTNPTSNPPATNTIPSATGVSLSELSNHNTESDCWVAYDGKVYDITSFLPNHPGSARAIAPYCGTSDSFKNAFERKHGTSKVQTLMSIGVLMGDFDVMGTLNQ